MAALSDLDSLLGDLERTCQGQKSQLSSPNTKPTQETTRNSPQKTVNELDILLQDLSMARYSADIDATSPVPRKSKENDAVIREMESSTKMEERRVTSTQAAGEPDNEDSKWEYMGYGIWENSEKGAVDFEKQQQPIYQIPTSSPVPPSSAAAVAGTAAAASSATQELDDLMSSLNDFKLKGKEDIPVVTANLLDDMLGNLKEDMDKQGVKTTQKGVCNACNKPIVGQVITALGKTWHPEHFVCVHCREELGTQNFFERDNHSYCERDYHELFSPRCGHCNEAILDKCLSALDQTFHPGCFFCADCGGAFGDDGFHDKDEKPYCTPCFTRLFAPRCGGCGEAISDATYVSSLDRQWHPDCFVCTECRVAFAAGNYFAHENKPYCETHYHALKGSLCATCRKPISGRCITAMFRKFHPEHFVCSFCLKQLNKGTFKERKEKPYCHECHERLFG